MYLMLFDRSFWILHVVDYQMVIIENLFFLFSVELEYVINRL